MHCHRNLHKTAWAGVGSGVLFFDPGGTGAITQKNQYVFTEWDPTAQDDMQALRNAFDSNGDGVFDASDAKWAQFKVMVTNADGTVASVEISVTNAIQIITCIGEAINDNQAPLTWKRAG